MRTQFLGFVLLTLVTCGHTIACLGKAADPDVAGDCHFRACHRLRWTGSLSRSKVVNAES